MFGACCEKSDRSGSWGEGGFVVSWADLWGRWDGARYGSLETRYGGQMGEIFEEQR